MNCAAPGLFRPAVLLDNVEVLWDTVVEKINGQTRVESITIGM